MEETYKVLNRRGYTSIIYELPGDPPRVCKAFLKDCMDTHYPIEKATYERFAAYNHPSSILKYYGIHEKLPAGIVLERAEGCDLHEYLWMQKCLGKASLQEEILYRWAGQAVEGLEFAHSLGVYNSDIHCVNLFLDQNLDLKVGDWAGASIDGSHSQSSYRLRHRLFAADGTDVPRAKGITSSTEIFALGTALYCMAALQDPWPELREPEDRDEIKKRISEKSFPNTSELPALADVIWKCWHVEFTSMTEVRHAIEDEKQSKGCKLFKMAVSPSRVGNLTGESYKRSAEAIQAKS